MRADQVPSVCWDVSHGYLIFVSLRCGTFSSMSARIPELDTRRNRSHTSWHRGSGQRNPGPNKSSIPSVCSWNCKLHTEWCAISGQKKSLHSTQNLSVICSSVLHRLAQVITLLAKSSLPLGSRYIDLTRQFSRQPAKGQDRSVTPDYY